MSRGVRTWQAVTDRGDAAIPIRNAIVVNMLISPQRFTYGVTNVFTSTGPALALTSFATNTPPVVTGALMTARPDEVSALATVKPVGSSSTTRTSPPLDCATTEIADAFSG